MKFRLTVLIVFSLCLSNVFADEGMWLLGNLRKNKQTDRVMKELGLQMPVNKIYDPKKPCLADAVVSFGGFCSGVVVSEDGLVFTNHHCGFSSIQQHSSVEHDYLKDGFFARSLEEELPNPELYVRFLLRTEDVTKRVLSAARHAKTETERRVAVDSIMNVISMEVSEKDSTLTGIVDAYYAGNEFWLSVYRDYNDVRLVFAPPSSVGKFGWDTDNWMWPRHTGDFSMFRIYADANGEPAEYSESNVPLKTKKHLSISIKGLKEGDYAMIMGFPGSTSRYLTVSEVKERMESENDPRIRIRGARLAVLKEVMNASDKIRIQYANKYAGSSNYWKNSIGMNKAIIDNDVLGTKAAQEAKFAEFAKAQNNAEYAAVVKNIDDLVAKTTPLNYQYTCLRETFFGAIEFGNSMLTKTREALVDKNDSLIKVRLEGLKENFKSIHNKDYDHEVDRKVAKALLPLYAEMIPANQRPSIYKVIEQKYKGDYNKFVDDMYDNSIFSNRENFEKFVKKPSVKAIDNDLALQYCQSKYDQFEKIVSQLEDMDKELTLLHKTYIRGLGEMKQPVPSYPDANFTIRLTYGNVKPYDPKDGVHYNYYTTTKGILEKENPEDREFVVPAKLKELIEKKDYGRYALPNGDMPVCFLSTNDITGGNSGSPVLNENGELIGCAFDGNWESLSGDINFDNNLQRCINLDIRYVLFILEKLGNCGHLINEMTIVE